MVHYCQQTLEEAAACYKAADDDRQPIAPLLGFLAALCALLGTPQDALAVQAP